MAQLIDVKTGDAYSLADALRLTGLSRADLKALAEAGLLPEGGSEEAFDFQDLVLMRTSRQLREAGIPRQRIRQALEKLRDQVDKLTTTRVWCDGKRIVAQQGSGRWQPESGQGVLNFEAEPVPAARMARMPQPASEAADWFARACSLEAASPDDAIEAYRRAIELDPDHQEAHVNLGRMLHERGELAAAEEHYRAAATMAPDDAICCYNLGVVLQDQGRDNEALAAYENALAIDPELRDAHFNLAQLYERSGKRLSALQHLSDYRRLSR